MSYAVDNRFCVHIFMYFDLDDHLFAVSRFGFLSYACRFVHVLQARSEESLNSILRAISTLSQHPEIIPQSSIYDLCASKRERLKNERNFHFSLEMKENMSTLCLCPSIRSSVLFFQSE